VALSEATVGSWKDIFEASSLKPILISVTLILLQQFSGIFPVTVYTVDIFRSAGTSIDENLSVNLIGVLQVVRETVYGR
jgi:facilitated trehalose transporter